MDKFLSLVISGTVTGGIYSIMASGLVLTYTTSGIFNFAQGAIAFAVAYFYYQLNSGGMPIVPAAILSILIFAPLMGYALDRLLLRRLAEAPVYAKVVGTIGLLVAIPNFMQWVVVTLGNSVFHAGLVGNKARRSGAVHPRVWARPRPRSSTSCRAWPSPRTRWPCSPPPWSRRSCCGSSCATPGSAWRCGRWSTGGIWPGSRV